MPATRRNRRVVKDVPSDSSDSEPDTELEQARRRWAPQAPAAPAANAEKKKKKKKRLPPQESVDKLWEQFSQKRFSKVTNVLPVAPLAPSPLSARANELLSRDYERAADECRRKVNKIIQECRRVNMRYRDPGWDIDWDLKMQKGHCLNSLGHTKFDISVKNMASTSASVPKAVKRVHEIFENPTFMKNVSGSDVKQGCLGDCWFISCVSGLANVPGGLERACVAYDTKIGIYGFVFYRDGEWIYSIIDDKLYLTSPCWDSPSVQRDLLEQIDREDIERVYRKTYQTGSKALFFAQNKDQNETWLPLMEKAYAKAHGDYNSLTGGWIGEGLEDVTGGVTTELLMSDIFDIDSFWDNELSRVNEEFLFGCTTGLMDRGYGNRGGITEGHAYNIMEARVLKNGTRLLKLRNPWGKIKAGTWEGAWSDGSKEWTTEIKEEVGHTFGSDSSFWISYEDFLRKYEHIDRTRLFREPDWRCCQRWIGVDVPWKTTYNEKFHIKLTKASPLVLLLSQLDSRYFQGLVGQYYFRLRFRLHEQNKPDAEDYVVRSHGNYLMDRSVSVELPLMEPGSYSVFLSVEAERASSSLSVEDVVKRELKKRVENEKLAQVGQAYDLAHSKAAAHFAELAKLRKKTDQQKASTERKQERRKEWAKRHLLKDIQKRQQAKNAAKWKLQEAAREEERKKKEAAAAAEAEEKKKAEEAEAAERQKVAQELKRTQDKEAQTEPSAAAAKTDDKGTQADADLQVAAKAADGADAAKPATSVAADDVSQLNVISASTSGTSTPSDTPLGTPKTETVKELILGMETADGVVLPSTSDVSGAPPPLPVDATAETKSASTGDAEKTADSASPKDVEKAKKTEPADKSSSPSSSKDKKDKKKKNEESADDSSSDSPIEDWEEWYSSDDLSTKASRAANAAATAAAAKVEEDTEDENEPTPWNAICVVGIRVYSKDENLELRVVMEGSGLAEGGMGEKGEQDLDNAQANAGGQRTKKDTASSDKEDKTDAAEPVENKDKVAVDVLAKEDDGKTASDDAEITKASEAGDNDGKNVVENNGTKEKTAAPDDNVAPYSTIVQKDDEEFEQVSAPAVVVTEAADGTGPKLDADVDKKLSKATVDNTLLWG
ncbi:Peptidase C2, calpain, catalytic domain protein [Niveomyces insectorum RCEF 264]|uniref:Peptidase C2, calpain, catalytic domain protein n=1 Tax=Niveomyces insectorum RCEF 264 TaxID=1081102 RepID=A0A167P528_9HYPO|nr:Peptidase C2, calpain, catalytic domain protein [Niveomyces insectorum RCEF 264]